MRNILFATALSAAILGTATAQPAANPVKVRELIDFEQEQDLQALRQNAYNAKLELAQDRGVTSGTNSLRLTGRQGGDWVSFTLDEKAIGRWGDFDRLEVDVYTEDDHPYDIALELWDTFSHNFHTRATLGAARTKKGAQTLAFNIERPYRNKRDPKSLWLPWERVGLLDKAEKDALTRVKIFFTPRKDRDAVLWLDRFRLAQTMPRKLTPNIPSFQERRLFSFEHASEIDELMKASEGAAMVQDKEQGVTHGKYCAKLTGKQGANWTSVTLGGEKIRDWGEFEYLAFDLQTDDTHSYGITLELCDRFSRDLLTRCTLKPVPTHAGTQTLLFEIKGAARNQLGQPVEGNIRLDELSKVKLYFTPRKDRDAVLRLDNLRLLRNAIYEALYEVNFEDGKGIEGSGPYYGRWTSNFGNNRLAIEPPAGAGNVSRKALTYRKRNERGWCSFETTSLRPMIVEPFGWDGGVSFKMFNGGFRAFYAIYLPDFPSDIEFHRAYFNVPPGEWADINLPLDKFLYHGRRPRRGTELERLVFAAEGPTRDDAFYQLDDVQIYRIRRLETPVVKRELPLPEGIVYAQNFDYPEELDFHQYSPWTQNCNVYWAARGGDADKENKGCLKIECYDKGNRAHFEWGRDRVFFSGGDTIEFDILAHGAANLYIIGQWGGRSRLALPPCPPNAWTNISIPVVNMPPKDPKARFKMLYFGGWKDGSQQSYVLLDNLVIRRGTASAPK